MKKKMKHLKKNQILKTPKIIYFFCGIFLGLSVSYLPIIDITALENVSFFKKVNSSLMQKTDENDYSKFRNLPLEKVSSANSKLLPVIPTVINRTSYSLAYEARTKNPLWVYEKVTKESLQGKAVRDHCKFSEDEQIDSIFRTTLQDFQGSGFDRGHMAASANHKLLQQAMADTFLLSNISPQHPKLNRGAWSQLEKKVRDLTKQYDVIHIFTGPLYLPQDHPDGTRWVQYRVIGKSDIAVPTHFYKVLFLEKTNKITPEAYILPNEAIENGKILEQFKVTIDKVEKVSGIIFRK